MKQMLRCYKYFHIYSVECFIHNVLQQVRIQTLSHALSALAVAVLAGLTRNSFIPGEW